VEDAHANPLAAYDCLRAFFHDAGGDSKNARAQHMAGGILIAEAIDDLKDIAIAARGFTG